jgi:hypothetical protein
MILNEYFRFERLENTVSKNRLDLTAWTCEIAPLFMPNDKGQSWFYTNSKPPIKSTRAKQPSFSLTARAKWQPTQDAKPTQHITSVYLPEIEQPEFGYGNLQGTSDALLFVLSENPKRLELFIAREKKSVEQAICNLAIEQDKELLAQMDFLRKRAERI